jgi:geranylgeranyl diphosphate synthase type I
VFEMLYKRYGSALDNEMRRIVASQPNQPPDFGTMLGYSLGWVDAEGAPYHQATGKRIRPLLLLLCAESTDGNWHSALPAAAAVEILHNFSLIHDDIQDDSPIRHNRPTVWKVWGTANAINAGDALFTLAYSALEGQTASVTPQVALELWRIFNHTALELTRGQHLDMRFEHQASVTVDEYIEMISGKTAALLAACAQMGGLIGSGDSTRAAHFAEFGLNLGIAFQMQDDILGIWGDPGVTGKSAATDILSRKKSFPVLFGLERSERLQAIYRRESFGDADVKESVAELDAIDAQEAAYQSEQHYYQLASAALDRAHPRGDSAKWLRQLIEELFKRTH